MSIKFGETVSNGIGKFGNLNAVHHIICVHAYNTSCISGGTSSCINFEIWTKALLTMSAVA